MRPGTRSSGIGVLVVLDALDEREAQLPTPMMATRTLSLLVAAAPLLRVKDVLPLCPGWASGLASWIESPGG